MSDFDIAAAYAAARASRHLTWAQAVDAMRAGHVVRRASDMFVNVLEDGDGLNPAIIESGVEAIRLHVAVTDDGAFVNVFQGADSRCLFEPNGEGDDWVVVDDRKLW